MNREPFPQAALQIPVYDLATFTKPWPVTAIKEILGGAEYSEVLKKYSIPVIPQLSTSPAEEPSLF
jgi:hypothetical protein